MKRILQDGSSRSQSTGIVSSCWETNWGYTRTWSEGAGMSFIGDDGIAFSQNRQGYDEELFGSGL